MHLLTPSLRDMAASMAGTEGETLLNETLRELERLRGQLLYYRSRSTFLGVLEQGGLRDLPIYHTALELYPEHAK